MQALSRSPLFEGAAASNLVLLATNVQDALGSALGSNYMEILECKSISSTWRINLTDLKQEMHFPSFVFVAGCHWLNYGATFFIKDTL